MKIGALAATAGTSAETIRYYEREGLLGRPSRTDANYRVYGPADAERLHFIRRCRSLDMALPEIRALLAARDRPDGCAEAADLVDAHLGHVEDRLRDLQALRGQLQALRGRCTGPGPEPQAAACGILSALAEKETAPTAGTAAHPNDARLPHPAGAHRPGAGRR
jgi:Cd(II)/Pb(II)-responsive transcriptional regulator